MMSSIVRAAWVLPIAGAPVRDGWVSVENGRVQAGGPGRPPAPAPGQGHVAVLPGQVNAHTHLELSGLGGRVAPAQSVVAWIRAMLAERAKGAAGAPAAVARAAQAARDTGTVLFGDVSNRLDVAHSVRGDGVVFHEILGFNPVDPAGMVRAAHARLRAYGQAGAPDLAGAVVAHAPYSTAPALIAAIASRHEGPAPLSTHLAESAEEVEFLHTGRGPFRDLLMEVGTWTPAWTTPRCGPVEYLRRMGHLQEGTLLAHCVHLTPSEIEQVRDAGAVIVTCPRSNAWVGGGVPQVSRFYGAGVPVAIGTDSLASTDTLNMFDELAALRRLAPEVDAALLLESATRMGAEALGWGRHYGTLSPGRLARMVAVDLPVGTGTRSEDVEEYLVSGVPVAGIRPCHP